MSSLKIGEIDIDRKPIEPEIFLCKPNKVVISKLSEAHEVSLGVKLGALNEMSFRIPQFIEKKHQMVRNSNADIIRGRYILKLVLGDFEEYFVINNITKNGGGEEYLEIQSLSLGYELNDKIIRDYSELSMTATEQLTDMLDDTIWTIGYVDAEFDMKRRALEVSSSTVLEVIFDIAKTFNALTLWDTVNRQVGLYNPDSIGIDRGFKVKYGKYLESLNHEDNSEEIITRLKLYGKEDITIREINPVGTVYIEDFTYFLYPFKRDTSRNVIEHSEYMSDELCHAILDYNDLLEAKKSNFEIFRARKEVFVDELGIKNGELFDLNTEYKQLLDSRDILNTRISSRSDALNKALNKFENASEIRAEIADLEAQLETKLDDIYRIETRIASKKSEIVIVEQNIQGVEIDINILKDVLSIERNFSSTLIEERNQFIIEKEWQDSNIEDPKDLLKEGLVAFEELKKQKITSKIDLVNFLSMISEQRNWDKLNIGDTFYIDYDRLNVSYTAKLTEIDYDFDDKSVSVTISNIKDTFNKDKFLEMIYKSYGTSTQVSLDKWKWDLSLDNNGSINQIINNMWDANKQAIIGAKDQVVEISDRGLIIRDDKDPMTYLVGLNGMIAITNDGGRTWKHAITGEGIVGERIYGKIFMGVNLALEDEDGVLKFQGSKGEVFDRFGNLVMQLGLIEENPDQFGLRAMNSITRVTISDLVGFAIEKASVTAPTGWEKVFWANQSDGTVYTKGLVAQNIKIVNNVGDEILNAETNYFDIGAFNTIVADNKLTTLEKLQIIKELNRVYSGYKLLLEQADKYKRVHRDDLVDVNSQFLSSTSSTIDRYSVVPLQTKYIELMEYMKQYIKFLSSSPHNPLSIDLNDRLTETTSDISDRALFILKFKEYYDEADKLRNAIQDAQFYSGIQMGEFYNNISMSTYGFIALRNDGKYRAFMNATNGLALQKWENNHWVNKVYASIGNSEYEDGTLIAEDLVAKRLTIRTSEDLVLLDSTALKLDFTTLDRIVLDNIIVSTEKISLSNQLKSVEKQYESLVAEATKFANEVFTSRDKSYTGLDEARTTLTTAIATLSTSYSNLTSYMNPVFVDMNKTTHIVNDLHSTRTIFHSKWSDFYSAYEKCRNALDGFLEKSSLQLGRNYNNTVIDAENGITVTRGDELYRAILNATSGLSLEKKDGANWIKMLYANVDGSLAIRSLKVLNDKDEITFEIDKDGRVTVNTYSDDGKSTTTIKGGFVEAKGTYTRTWNTFFSGKVTETNTTALRFENGYIRARNATKNRSLYFSDYGIATTADGSGTGAIEFESTVYNSHHGITVSSDGVLGLISYQSYINISPEWDNSGNNTFSFQVIDADAYTDTDGLILYGSHRLGYGSGLRMDKGYPILYLTDGAGKRGEGKLVAKSVESYLSQTLTLKVDNDNYIQISSSGIKIKGTRIDLN